MGFAVLGGERRIFSGTVSGGSFNCSAGNLMIIRCPGTRGVSTVGVVRGRVTSVRFFRRPFVMLRKLCMSRLRGLRRVTRRGKASVTAVIRASRGSVDGANSGGTGLGISRSGLSGVGRLTRSFSTSRLVRLTSGGSVVLRVLRRVRRISSRARRSRIHRAVKCVNRLVCRRCLLTRNGSCGCTTVRNVKSCSFRGVASEVCISIGAALCDLGSNATPFCLRGSRGAFVRGRPGRGCRVVQVSLGSLSLRGSCREVESVCNGRTGPVVSRELGRSYLGVTGGC